jgi:hypothetical protein
MIYQRKGDYRLRSIAGVGGLLTGPVVLNKVSRRILYIPSNGVFRYLFLSAYIDRMWGLVARWFIEAVLELNE